MKENVILNKSFDFALRIVKLYKYLTKTKNEYILSKQHDELLKRRTNLSNARIMGANNLVILGEHVKLKVEEAAQEAEQNQN